MKIPEEITHMFRITRPKLVFCDFDRIEIVKRSLKELGNDASIFTFGGLADVAQAVEKLLVESTPDEEFM